MKIEIEGTLLKMTPENDREKKELERLWNLVVDCVKGVEEQTRNLMTVCRMRGTPVIVFINKLDREGKDPFELLDELERELGIHTRPLTWPIGMGTGFPTAG